MNDVVRRLLRVNMQSILVVGDVGRDTIGTTMRVGRVIVTWWRWDAAEGILLPWRHARARIYFRR